MYPFERKESPLPSYDLTSNSSVLIFPAQSVDCNTASSEPSDSGKSVVLLMVRDAYANYVVQTTLDVVPESEEKQRLLQELNSHADELVSLHAHELVFPVVHHSY